MGDDKGEGGCQRTEDADTGTNEQTPRHSRFTTVIDQRRRSNRFPASRRLCMCAADGRTSAFCDPVRRNRHLWTFSFVPTIVLRIVIMDLVNKTMAFIKTVHNKATAVSSRIRFFPSRRCPALALQRLPEQAFQA